MISAMRFFKYLLILSLFFAVTAIGLTGYFYYWLVTPIKSVPSGDVIVVNQGDSLHRVALNLADAGLLEWPEVWRFYARFFDTAPIKAGEYHWPVPAVSPRQVLDLLQEGDVIKYHVTLVEGQTVAEFLNTLHQLEKLTVEIVDRDPLAVAKALDMHVEHAEGWFFPDTYQYTAGDSDLSIMQRAYQKMQHVLARAWQEKQSDLPFKSPYEVLIMASIVEKETGAAFEREAIAGVFVRRLQLGMRLQTDPTVIYGLGQHYSGNLTRAHLRADSAYNTYRIRGLPPTPIANPGAGAIWAAVNPAPGKALYFVARGDGTHVFSETLEAHNRAVDEYQRYNRSDQYRSSPN